LQLQEPFHGLAEGTFSQTSLQNLWFCEARKIFDFAWVSKKVFGGSRFFANLFLKGFGEAHFSQAFF